MTYFRAMPLHAPLWAASPPPTPSPAIPITALETAKSPKPTVQAHSTPAAPARTARIYNKALISSTASSRITQN